MQKIKPRKPEKEPNRDLLEVELIDLIDLGYSLCQLAEITEWDELHNDLAEYFSDEGNPAKSVRLVVGLLYLKAMYDLLDEQVLNHWV